MSSVDQSLSRAGLAPSEGAAKDAASLSGRETIPFVSAGVLAAMAIVSAILVPSRMLLSTGPQDDGPVFAYIGWAMKRGLLPYRDIWDHKGPLLYYLQSAGFSLTPDSTLGIGVLELIAFSITFFLIYRVIASFGSRFVCRSIALFSVVYVQHFFGGGNMTESWALLPLAAAHYACWRWSQRTSRYWCAPVLGISFACIFWLRANMTVYPAVAMLLLLYASSRKEGVYTALRQLGLGLGAALAITTLILAPLYGWGVFHDFVAAYFGYNAAYSSGLSLSSRYEHTSQLVGQLFTTAIALLGTAGLALGMQDRRENGNADTGVPSLYLRTLLWSVPFELAAATLSGRDYPHYLLPLFPTFAVLAAFFLAEFEKQSRVFARTALIFSLLLALCVPSLTTYYADISRSTEPIHPQYLAIARFIRSATATSDKITVIGDPDAPFISFLARRLPASRFVYQLPLIDANNPAAGDQRKQFVCELAQNRPAVIVSGNPMLGILCASDLECALRNVQPAVSEYGYQTRLLPKLLENMVATEYHPVSDPRFGDMRVLLRNDIAIPTHW